jgi:SAM-dependent methyltransferase
VSDPCNWLVDNGRLLPRAGTALDVACGRGRNAIWLAGRGLKTIAIDRDESAVAFVNQEATRHVLPLWAQAVDLENGPPFLQPSSFDVIVVVHYLHRPLFPALVAALRPGGILVYETFTRAQAARGQPTNPAFLLEPGELEKRVQPLEIVASREGDFDDRMVASVIARRSRAH